MRSRHCSETQDELALARLEGVPLSAAARDHVLSCPGCRLERLQLEDLLGRLDADSIPDPGEEYWRAFLPRIRARLAAESLATASPVRARWWAVAATAASFFIAALAAGGWKAPAELDATARLHRLAVGTDAEGLQQALDLIAPDGEADPAGETGSLVPLAAHMQKALEEAFPEDEPGIYESSGEHSAEQRPARSLDEGWV